jgi:hypothetical protein
LGGTGGFGGWMETDANEGLSLSEWLLWCWTPEAAARDKFKSISDLGGPGSDSFELPAVDDDEVEDDG